MNQFNKNYKLLNIIFVGDLNSYTRSIQRAIALKQISNIFYEISHTTIETNKICKYTLR